MAHGASLLTTGAMVTGVTLKVGRSSCLILLTLVVVPKVVAAAIEAIAQHDLLEVQRGAFEADVKG
jgi:hypothetical protein